MKLSKSQYKRLIVMFMTPRHRRALAQHMSARESIYYTGADPLWSFLGKRRVVGWKRGREIANAIAFEEYATERAINQGIEEAYERTVSVY